jgi:hypothetical protein
MRTPTLDDLHQPILLELDEATWKTYLDRTERWLGNTLMSQVAFRRQAAFVASRLREPHFRELISRIAETSGRHEQSALDLYRIIGRRPARWREVAGMVQSGARTVLADAIGLAGGATSPWRHMRQLLVSSLDAMSAFATCEQLGYALGMPELAQPCFEVVGEKHTQHLLLQELTLEIVPIAIHYRMGF